MHKLIRRAALALPLCLAACVGGDSAVAFRNGFAPIWSAAAFDPVKILGDWRQVGGFSNRMGGCGPGNVRFQPAAQGVQMTGQLCLNGRVERLAGLVRATGPGRFLVGDEEWWVLWVDSGYRTLAIGTPSGRFGLLLDRDTIPPDRFQAAREVFEFNGYAPAKLQPF